MPQAILTELHSVEEVTRRLGGVSKWSVYSWLSKGRLRKTKVGSRVMISESDLQAFLKDCNPAPEENTARGHWRCADECSRVRGLGTRAAHWHGEVAGAMPGT